MVGNQGDLSSDRTIYRNWTLKNNLTAFNVTVRESDIFIYADSELTSAALDSLQRHRSAIESYISGHPQFRHSLLPIAYDQWAPDIVREMLKSSETAGVGPMASVAGAIAERVGIDLLHHSRNVIVENGGDIYINTLSDVVVGLFSGRSPLSGRVAIKARKEEMPLGICTSSGTIGHSLSFGISDACCVKSRSAALADAAATAIGNFVKSAKDIPAGLNAGMKIEGVLGIVIIAGDQLGAVGDMELVRV
ncbi:MAG: UPF0280 family protein [Deltaproteobacteria bacterium]|nr:UPF0280 family protein [Deltaproteobacteria bacterium]